MSLRFFLPLYLLAYFASAFFWRSFIVWKQTGINPVVFKQTDSAHDFIGRVFKILFATIVIVVLVGFAPKVLFVRLRRLMCGEALPRRPLS